jgi:alkyl sulfatase BDS1-like metallo-beta-lactamase superfamily hydrolase
VEQVIAKEVADEADRDCGGLTIRCTFAEESFMTRAVLALQPELVLPSHGMALKGNAEIVKRLTRYRDAIQYVHDETVKGMNAGKDVWTLMNEIRLPAALDIGESYGKLSWSVRGIYEGYVGWFDLQPALTVDGKHQAALQAKLKALETLRARCKNSNERGWLDFSINRVKAKLGAK